MSDFSQQLYAGEAEQFETPTPHLMEIDPSNLLYGMNMGLLFIYGVTMYASYPGAINGNPSTFPERVSNTCEIDRDWAL
jgi:hypothetical protein